jgi:hypothetical protein
MDLFFILRDKKIILPAYFLMDAPAPAWETSKENVKRARRGRKVAVLNARLVARETRSAADAATLKLEQAAHEAAIASYGGDDPLAPWLTYLAWIKASFPVDSDGSVSATLLKVTEEFASDARYTNSKRYVKLWIERAVMHDALALEIFQHMRTKNIGGDLAIFWSGYALVAERGRNFRLADRVFKEGIARGAKPIDTLKKKRRQFDRRYVRYNLNQQAAEEAGVTVDTATADDATVGKAASEGLARLEERRRARESGASRGGRRRNAAALASIPVVREADAENAASARGRGARRRGLGGTRPRQPPPRAQVDADDFQIYTGGDEPAGVTAAAEAGPVPATGAATDNAAPAPAGEWGSCALGAFGDAAERERENQRKVEAWNGATLAKPRTKKAQRASRKAEKKSDDFDIFVEEAALPAAPRAPAVTAAAAVAAAPKLEGKKK